ncbi:amidase [Arthrobacter sulfonylureivorans]|uniref:Amidase n=1 Tax=Arthrobacter sulfonylureivorans TaxID=2486855 RepID=A0ABY3W711_9MICC|nr:amidase [Arthrobacter sulfonylureivorans]UNK46095.1 amidase [Arthrobacter sulfonylureivorans]
MQYVAPKSLEKSVTSLARGESTAMETVCSALDRIAMAEADLHAWVTVDAAGALAAAEQLDRLPIAERGPLHGVPVGVKDIIDVAGLPTRCGSVLRNGTPAAADAAVVALLRRLGAVVLGKTVTTEFAYFSPGPTANPHDPSRTPGGSSSGSAAAVAAGMVPLALGTQTAASVSRPAAYCGVTGFVTARGTYPEGGITGLSPSLDSLGFLTASVADMDFLLRVLNNCDPAVPACPATAPAPVRVLSWTPAGSFAIEPAMLEALRTAEQSLASLGHPVLPLDFDVRGARLVDAHSAIMAYDAVRLRSAEAASPDGISPQLAALFEAGRATGDDEYTAAHAAVAEELAWLQEEQAGGSVLMAPAAQGPAPQGLSATGSPLMSRPWQALGLPVLVVPGLVEPASGMPLGIQFACLPGDEELLFAAAAGLERQLRAAAPSGSAAPVTG